MDGLGTNLLGVAVLNTNHVRFVCIAANLIAKVGEHILLFPPT